MKSGLNIAYVRACSPNALENAVKIVLISDLVSEKATFLENLILGESPALSVWVVG